MPDTLSMLDVTTRRYIDTNPALRDLVFNYDPLNAMIGENCHEEVPGGLNWNDNIEYDVQDGGAYAKGQDLPADNRQIEQQLRFDPKFNVIMVSFFKEDIKVFNTGSLAVVSLVETRVNAAYTQLGAHSSLQFYLNGVDANYTKFPNGATEAYSDGTTAGWNNNTYPQYGTLTRANYGGRMLAPAPINFAGGPITLPKMETLYQSVNYGSGPFECNVAMTTPIGQGLIRNQYQTQQRFQNVEVGKAGFRGLQYNGATIMASRYCPGSYLMASSGTADRVATRMFAYSTEGAITAYPTPSNMSTGGVFGETIWFLNVRKPMIKYRTSANAPFNGSLDDDGFIPSAGSTKIVGKILLAHNFSLLPGYGCYGYNFQS